MRYTTLFLMALLALLATAGFVAPTCHLFAFNRPEVALMGTAAAEPTHFPPPATLTVFPPP